MTILERAQALKPDLIAWRHALHQMPEVGMELPQTIDYISSELTKMGFEHQILPNGAGIMGEFGQGEKTLLLRSDIDALPIEEESGEDFASTNGCMHACGHDLHGTILLGALRLLKDDANKLGGRVRFIFQSGEETMSGAKEVVAQGLTDGVDAAFGGHVMSQLPIGIFIFGQEAMASCTNFSIDIKGKGGHGSMPEKCIDPIHAGVHTYLALEELIAREMSGTDEAVVTIGAFNAGSATNIIPQTAQLLGTIRAFDMKKRDYIIDRIQEMLRGIDIMSRTESKFTILNGCDTLVCDNDMNSLSMESIKKIMPQCRMIDSMHGMGSEDFAAVSQVVPSSFVTMGAAVGDPRQCFGQHNPHVRFNDDVLPIGTALYVQVTHDYFKNHQN